MLKTFFTRFRGLKTLKGITEAEFNPLDVFIREGKRVNSLSWTIPEKDEERRKVWDFLEFNRTVDLRLFGGTLERVNVPTLFMGEHT